MRLITWNCNMALHRKFVALGSLRPDIAIVPECAEIDRLKEKAPLFVPENAVWMGDNPNKGMGVFANNGYSLRLHPSYDPTNQIVAPIEVTGPVSFHLLAIWSFNFRGDPNRSRQLGPILNAIGTYRDFCLTAPLVVAGDFNNHVIWDKPGKVNNHAGVVDALAELGLASAYHVDRGVDQGAEPEPTHYWRDRKKDGPTYHIDYIFIPGQWQARMREMYVGSFDEWCGSGLSDHVPLAVDIELETT